VRGPPATDVLVAVSGSFVAGGVSVDVSTGSGVFCTSVTFTAVGEAVLEAGMQPTAGEVMKINNSALIIGRMISAFRVFVCRTLGIKKLIVPSEKNG
jgi:hypothetical protein